MLVESIVELGPRVTTSRIERPLKLYGRCQVKENFPERVFAPLKFSAIASKDPCACVAEHWERLAWMSTSIAVLRHVGIAPPVADCPLLKAIGGALVPASQTSTMSPVIVTTFTPPSESFAVAAIERWASCETSQTAPGPANRVPSETLNQVKAGGDESDSGITGRLGHPQPTNSEVPTAIRVPRKRRPAGQCASADHAFSATVGIQLCIDVINPANSVSLVRACLKIGLKLCKLIVERLTAGEG